MPNGYCQCGKPSQNLRDPKDDDCASCKQRKRKESRFSNLVIQMPKRKIRRVSEKREKLNSQYDRDKKKFIKGKRCAVFPAKLATDIHHQKGRDGYDDQWARLHNIPLLLDQRYWLPVSREGHIWIGENPAEARKRGFNLPRYES